MSSVEVVLRLYGQLDQDNTCERNRALIVPSSIARHGAGGLTMADHTTQPPQWPPSLSTLSPPPMARLLKSLPR